MYIACDAILFDLDGTLIDSRSATERSWRLWAEFYGLDASQVLRVCHGRRTEDTVASFLPESEQQRAIQRLDERELLDLEDITPMPGAARLLENLKESPWAVVTSCTIALLEARLCAAGLPFPRVVVTADDVSAGKPDPSGYLQAAGELGVATPRCVVIEDVSAGVRAGKQAGARVLAVTSTHPVSELEGADWVIPSLESLKIARHGDPIKLQIA